MGQPRQGRASIVSEGLEERIHSDPVTQPEQWGETNRSLISLLARALSPRTLPAVSLRLLIAVLLFPLLHSCATKPPRVASEWSTIESFITAQRQAGHPNYDPRWLFLVDPSTQRMQVISLKTRKVHETVRCGTGKRGLGFGSAQTPTGFFTMGGVRIARNADYTIQTGDSKKGVSGIYAEMLYPPTHPDPELRGYVPNNVVIHSYNPNASEMLRQRRDQRLIGRVPCTTGCPVPEIDEAHKLVPYLKQSAGRFDPTANPNANLRKLINSGQVREYQRSQLGAPIYIRNSWSL